MCFVERYLSDDQMHEIKHCLLGTCQQVDAALESLDIDPAAYRDEVNDRLLDGSDAVELCVGCEWWHNPCDLEFDESQNGGLCDHCKPDEE